MLECVGVGGCRAACLHGKIAALDAVPAWGGVRSTAVTALLSCVVARPAESSIKVTTGGDVVGGRLSKHLVSLMMVAPYKKPWARRV